MKNLRFFWALLLAIISTTQVVAQEAYAALSSDGKTLTFYYDNLRSTRGTTHNVPWNDTYPGWTSSNGDATIETVNFDESFAGYHGLTHTQNMFYKMTALKNVNHTDYFDAGSVTMTSFMFSGCTSLTSLDMRCFDTGKLARMTSMFANCTNLATIYANTDWKTSSHINSSNMFLGCTKLKNYRNGNYPSQCGYDARLANTSWFFTSKIEAYAVLDNGTLTFCYDTRRMSRTGTTYSIPWNGVYPGWTSADGNADVTTVDFESSFARAPLTSTNKMFYKLSNLTTVNNLNNLNTENVTNMVSMFEGCSRLTTLDLLRFNVDNVQFMVNMFKDCSSLTTINANDDWSTGVVFVSDQMFDGCTSLKGGNGTAYNASHVDVAYAHADAADNAGYFTAVVEPYAVLSGTTLTFYYDTQRPSRPGITYILPWEGERPDWYGDDEITAVDFDTSFKQYRGLTSAKNMFKELSGLQTVSNLRQMYAYNVKDMSYMFAECSSLTSIDLTGLTTTQVTTMENMFYGCTSLQSLNLSGFYTSMLTNASGMFGNCTSLTNISGLRDLSFAGVTNMSYVFGGCSSLTSIDLRNFKTNNAKNMSAMFYGCSALGSLDLSTFQTKNATDMSYMFYNCSSLTNLDVSNLQTANVTTMDEMFYGCSSLASLDLRNFKMENMESMNNMFEGCSALQTIYCNDTWTCDNGYSMFYNCTSLVGGNNTAFDDNYDDISRAHPDGGTSNPGYFTSAARLYGVLDESTGILTIYYNDSPFVPTEGKVLFNIVSEGPEWMSTSEISIVDFDASVVDYEGLTSAASMFSGLRSLTEIRHLERLNTNNVTNMSNMFYMCRSLTSLDLSSLNTSNVTNTSSMFASCQLLESVNLSNFNTSKVTNMYNMFYGCSALTSIDMSSFDTHNVTDMSRMFYNCSSITSLDIRNFNMDKVTNVVSMFQGCSALETIYCNDVWNTYGWYVFKDCTSLVGGNGTTYDANNVGVDYARPDLAWDPGYFTSTLEPYAVVDGATLTFYYDDLRSTRTGETHNIPWSTDDYPAWAGESRNHPNTTITTAEFDDSFAKYYGLTSTCGMFANMTALSEIKGIENLKTDNVTTMFAMFSNCSGLASIDVSGFNTENVEYMTRMFEYLSLTVLDVSGFNTQNLKSTDWMFNNCTSLTTIYCNEAWQAEDSSSMFNGCRALVGGKGTAFDSSHTNGDYAHPDGGQSDPGYFTYELKPYAVLNEGTLTFYYDSDWITRVGTKYGVQWDSTPEWYRENGNITSVSFDSSFGNYHGLLNARSMFGGMINITTINGLTFLNTENVTNMTTMFYHCSSLKSLDLTNFKIENVEMVDFMFANCTALETIYCNDTWTTGSSQNLFLDCTSLVGGKGTGYNAEHVDVGYARPDGGTSNPGYFTVKPDFVRGDVNKDGSITIADVTALVNIILGKSPAITEMCNTMVSYFIRKDASGDYGDAQTITLTGKALQAVQTALQLTPTELAAKLVRNSNTPLANGEARFMPVDASGNFVQVSPTDDVYGYWFSGDGQVVNYGQNSKVVVRLTIEDGDIKIMTCQYPGSTQSGDDFPIHMALVYKDDAGKQGVVNFTFHFVFDNSGAFNTVLQVALTPVSEVADVNQDGSITIADVTALVNIILGK